MIAGALAYGFALLVESRDISWPPREVIPGLYTLAGSFAIVGPLVLWRRAGSGGGPGEAAWMVGGLLVWLLDLAAVAGGRFRGQEWATPLEPSLLGPIALAVLLADWRRGRSLGEWSWTNVVGWVLGLIWVAVGLYEMVPRSPTFFAGP